MSERRKIELSPQALAFRDLQERQRSEFLDHLRKVNDAEWRAVLAEDLAAADPGNIQ